MESHRLLDSYLWMGLSEMGLIVVFIFTLAALAATEMPENTPTESSFKNREEAD